VPEAWNSNQVGDTVAKTDDEVAVGEDLEFQRKWWRFESGVWILFAILLGVTLAGAFGRGPIAKAERRSKDESIDVKYDRIQRTGTPSIVTVDFGPSSIRSGKVDLFVSESMVKELGAQRVVPSPERAVLGRGGLTYTFPASETPASVEFALEPAGPGLRRLKIQVVGMEAVNAVIFVMP
jgi:hypothetical protein